MPRVLEAAYRTTLPLHGRAGPVPATRTSAGRRYRVYSGLARGVCRPWREAENSTPVVATISWMSYPGS